MGNTSGTCTCSILTKSKRKPGELGKAALSLRRQSFHLSRALTLSRHPGRLAQRCAEGLLLAASASQCSASAGDVSVGLFAMCEAVQRVPCSCAAGACVAPELFCSETHLLGSSTFHLWLRPLPGVSPSSLCTRVTHGLTALSEKGMYIARALRE